MENPGFYINFKDFKSSFGTFIESMFVDIMFLFLTPESIPFWTSLTTSVHPPFVHLSIGQIFVDLSVELDVELVFRAGRA